MALDKGKLSKDFFDALSKNTVLTGKAKAELQAKCDAMAAAVDDFVKSVEVTVEVPSGSIAVSTVGSAAAQSGFSTSPGIGKTKTVV